MLSVLEPCLLPSSEVSKAWARPLRYEGKTRRFDEAVSEKYVCVHLTPDGGLPNSTGPGRAMAEVAFGSGFKM